MIIKQILQFLVAFCKFLYYRVWNSIIEGVISLPQMLILFCFFLWMINLIGTYNLSAYATSPGNLLWFLDMAQSNPPYVFASFDDSDDNVNFTYFTSNIFNFKNDLLYLVSTSDTIAEDNDVGFTGILLNKSVFHLIDPEPNLSRLEFGFSETMDDITIYRNKYSTALRDLSFSFGEPFEIQIDDFPEEANHETIGSLMFFSSFYVVPFAQRYEFFETDDLLFFSFGPENENSHTHFYYKHKIFRDLQREYSFYNFINGRNGFIREIIYKISTDYQILTGFHSLNWILEEESEISTYIDWEDEDFWDGEYIEPFPDEFDAEEAITTEEESDILFNDSDDDWEEIIPDIMFDEDEEYYIDDEEIESFSDEDDLFPFSHFDNQNLEETPSNLFFTLDNANHLVLLMQIYKPDKNKPKEKTIRFTDIQPYKSIGNFERYGGNYQIFIKVAEDYSKHLYELINKNPTSYYEEEEIDDIVKRIFLTMSNMHLKDMAYITIAIFKDDFVAEYLKKVDEVMKIYEFEKLPEKDDFDIRASVIAPFIDSIFNERVVNLFTEKLFNIMKDVEPKEKFVKILNKLIKEITELAYFGAIEYGKNIISAYKTLVFEEGLSEEEKLNLRYPFRLRKNTKNISKLKSFKKELVKHSKKKSIKGFDISDKSSFVQFYIQEFNLKREHFIETNTDEQTYELEFLNFLKKYTSFTLLNCEVYNSFFEKEFLDFVFLVNEDLHSVDFLYEDICFFYEILHFTLFNDLKYKFTYFFCDRNFYDLINFIYFDNNRNSNFKNFFAFFQNYDYKYNLEGIILSIKPINEINNYFYDNEEVVKSYITYTPNKTNKNVQNYTILTKREINFNNRFYLLDNDIFLPKNLETSNDTEDTFLKVDFTILDKFFKKRKKEDIEELYDYLENIFDESISETPFEERMYCFSFKDYAAEAYYYSSYAYHTFYYENFYNLMLNFAATMPKVFFGSFRVMLPILRAGLPFRKQNIIEDPMLPFINLNVEDIASNGYFEFNVQGVANKVVHCYSNLYDYQTFSYDHNDILTVQMNLSDEDFSSHCLVEELELELDGNFSPCRNSTDVPSFVKYYNKKYLLSRNLLFKLTFNKYLNKTIDLRKKSKNELKSERKKSRIFKKLKIYLKSEIINTFYNLNNNFSKKIYNNSWWDTYHFNLIKHLKTNKSLLKIKRFLYKFYNFIQNSCKLWFIFILDLIEQERENFVPFYWLENRRYLSVRNKVKEGSSFFSHDLVSTYRINDLFPKSFYEPDYEADTLMYNIKTEHLLSEKEMIMDDEPFLGLFSMNSYLKPTTLFEKVNTYMTTDSFFNLSDRANMCNPSMPLVKEKAFDIREEYIFGKIQIKDELYFKSRLKRTKGKWIDDFLLNNEFERIIFTPLYNARACRFFEDPDLRFYRGHFSSICSLNILAPTRTGLFWTYTEDIEESYTQYPPRAFLEKAFSPELMARQFLILTVSFIIKDYVNFESLRHGRSILQEILYEGKSIRQKKNLKRRKKVILYKFKVKRNRYFTLKLFKFWKTAKPSFFFINKYKLYNNNSINFFFRFEKEICRQKFFFKYLKYTIYKLVDFFVKSCNFIKKQLIIYYSKKQRVMSFRYIKMLVTKALSEWAFWQSVLPMLGPLTITNSDIRLLLFTDLMAIDFWDLEEEDLEAGATDEDPVMYQIGNNFDQDDDAFFNTFSPEWNFFLLDHDEYNTVDTDATTYMGLIEDFIFQLRSFELPRGIDEDDAYKHTRRIYINRQTQDWRFLEDNSDEEGEGDQDPEEDEEF